MGQWRMANLSSVKYQPMHVAKVLSAVLKHLDLPKISNNGFRGCGLVPFNPDVVNSMEILKSKKSGNQETNLSNDQSLPENDESIANAFTASDYQVALRIIDHLISPDTLSKFNECKKDRIWSGAFEDENLFEVWCKINERCEPQSLTSASTSISIDYRNTGIDNFSISRSGNSNQSSAISDSGLFANEDTSLREDISLQDYIVIEPVDNGPIISTEDAGLYFPKIVFQHSEESIINNQHDQAIDNNPSNDPVFPGNQLSATSETLDPPETQPIFDTLKQCYFWPGEIPKRRQKKRVKASNVKHQYIVSSEEIIAEQEEKLRQNLQKKKEIAERKLTRERNKKIRAEEKEIKLKEKNMVKEKAQMPIEAEKKKRGRKSAKKTEEKSKN
ncbi:uncharacterized protein LOC129799570 [Phlebotomus papatasi]|uniref:uncharacterized protein LOC129799570 n=1 Tax=Phlebotomus papatasi TaxID=29031 RepID=UPI00248390B7|nr:uncharacterized protein LOC129799570 [Phlebotomus papatasi]